MIYETEEFSKMRSLDPLIVKISEQTGRQQEVAGFFEENKIKVILNKGILNLYFSIKKYTDEELMVELIHHQSEAALMLLYERYSHKLLGYKNFVCMGYHC